MDIPSPEEIKDDEIEQIQSEEEDRELDTASYKIISYGADYTLSVLYEKLKNNEIIVPDFQRKYVWNIKRASKLIESFLLGLPVPEIFLAKDGPTGNFLVVDGQQRLKTIEAFKDGIMPITSQTFLLMDVKEKWNGKKYSDLDEIDKKRFNDSILRTKIFYQIDPPKDDTSIYHVFERLNTGGLQLQNQEVRNSIYHGPFNDLLHELNKNPIWREVYNMPLPNKRMKDEELILRFFALYYDFDTYQKPMNEFLSKFMAKKRGIREKEKEEIKKIFLETVKFIYDKIGPKAFRPIRNLNTAAFDSIMYTIAKNKDSLKDEIQKNIGDLFKNKEYYKSITEGTTDEETIKKRFRIAKEYLIKNEK